MLNLKKNPVEERRNSLTYLRLMKSEIYDGFSSINQMN